MKRALKKKSNLYSYLDATKVLESGSTADIAKARKDYWKLYSVEWRKTQRKRDKQFTISFTPIEAKDLLEVAKKHKRSRTRFIKDSCLAYMNKRFVIPDVIAIRAIQQELALNYNILKKLYEDNALPYQIGNELLKQMSELEQKILVELFNPKPLEQLIRETVTSKPGCKENLIELLQKL
jgi:hypothetical protein